MPLEKGLIQVYTGPGKGKTTAALGLALRAAGQDMKVYIIQFMKVGCHIPRPMYACSKLQVNPKSPHQYDNYQPINKP